MNTTMEDLAVPCSEQGTSGVHYKEKLSQTKRVLPKRTGGLITTFLVVLLSVFGLTYANSQLKPLEDLQAPSNDESSSVEDSLMGLKTIEIKVISVDDDVFFNGTFGENTSDFIKVADKPLEEKLSVKGNTYKLEGVTPVMLTEETVKAIKIKGQGLITWYVVQYNSTTFFVPTTDNSHPARVICPDGTIVDILGKNSRKYPELKTVWGVVTTVDGRYFNIDDTLWEDIQEIDYSTETASPAIIIESGNVVSSNKVAYNDFISNLIVQVETSQATDMLTELVTKEGYEVMGTIYTSEKGFRYITIRSYMKKNSVAGYRVCVFCLSHEIGKKVLEATGFSHLEESSFNIPSETPKESSDDMTTFSKYGLTEFTLKDMEDRRMNINLGRSQDTLEHFFWKRQHVLPRIVFIEDMYANADFFRVKVREGIYVTLGAADFETLLTLRAENKLTHEWFKPTTFSRLAIPENKAYLVVRNDDIFELNEDVVREFGENFNEGFEPEFFKAKSSDAQVSNPKKVRINISDEALDRWFRDGAFIPGLFVSASHVFNKRQWPFILRTEDFVLRKYFLNVHLIRNIMKHPRRLLPDYQYKKVADFLTARKADFQFDMIESERNKLAHIPWHHIDYNNTAYFLSGNCIDLFHNLSLEGVFTPHNLNEEIQLGPNDKFTRVHKDFFIFNFEKLLIAVQEGKVENKTLELEAKKCLNIPTVVNDTEATIVVEEFKRFEGQCNGELLNGTDCKGKFVGNYSYCIDFNESNECNQTTNASVTCEGLLTAVECNGTFKGLIKVNGTDYSIFTNGSFNAATEETIGYTHLNRSNSTENISLECKQGYKIREEVCKEAKLVKRFSTEYFITSLNQTCAGNLKIRTLVCVDGDMKAQACYDKLTKQEEGYCYNHYYSIECANNGNFAACPSIDAPNNRTDCINARWNGVFCEAGLIYVTIDDHSYFASTECNGEYEEGNHCNGTFKGTRIVCPKEGRLTEHCGDSFAVDSISCEGALTSKGCTGSWNASVQVNNTLNFSIHSSKDSIGSGLSSFSEGQVWLNLISNNKEVSKDEFNWATASVNCDQAYDDVEKICTNAIFRGDSKSVGGWDHVEIVCPGRFDLKTLECKDSKVTVNRCFNDKPKGEFPSCRGTHSHVVCQEGGNAFTCAKKSRPIKKSECVNAFWNGASCEDSIMIILVDERSYVTGTCNGVYSELESCKGETIGQLVVCPEGMLTPDTSCDLPEIHKFNCQGLADKYGCHGTFKGQFEARGEVIHIETRSKALTTYFKNVTLDTTLLTYVKKIQNIDARHTQGIIPETQKIDTDNNVEVTEGIHDAKFVATCKVSFDAQTHLCQDAEVNVTVVNGPISEDIKVRCKGVLNLETLACENGRFTFLTCKGEDLLATQNICRGEYIHLDCEHGGSNGNCVDPTPKDIQEYCFGNWTKGNCKVQELPQLAIIMINSTYYIKGNCPNKINGNKCQGFFEGTEVVTCSGDPLHKKADFDACTPIAGESFGNCTGLTNQEGCIGQYVQTLKINDDTYDFVTAEHGSKFNTWEVSGKSSLTRRPRDENDDYTEAVKCSSTFNVKELSCMGTIYVTNLKHPEGKGPGITQSTVTQCSKDGIWSYRQKDCHSGAYEHYECLGKSYKTIEKNSKLSVTCLGNLTYSVCSKGGNAGECFESQAGDFKKECHESFFDGKICLNDEPAKNSEIKITDLGRKVVKDKEGKDVIVHSFEVADFTMYGASAKEIFTSENIIDKMDFDSANIDAEGNVKDIDAIDSAAHMILDEGRLNKIKFSGFQLDELPYRRFCIDEEAKIVEVNFKSFTIKQMYVSHLKSTSVVIQSLNTGTELIRNKGADELDFAVAYGETTLKDIKTYLPSFSNSLIDKWLSDTNDVIEMNFEIPEVEGIVIPPYILRFPSKDYMFLEFPELAFEDKSLDIFTLEDYALSSDSFTSNPSQAKLLIEKYKKWLKESKANDVKNFFHN
jgi:hypothetical protein